MNPSDRMIFNLEIARHAAQLCRAAYHADAAGIAAEAGVESVETFSGGATFGFVAKTDLGPAVVFRGSLGARDDTQTAVENWLTNLDYAQVPTATGMIHRGFRKAIDSIRAQMTEAVRRVAPQGGPILVTGHSLGGALAILAAAELCDRYEVLVYTFASPRVADSTWCAAFKPRHYRVELGNDVGCWVPPPPEALDEVAALLRWTLPGGLKHGVPENVEYRTTGRLTYLGTDGSLQAYSTPEQEAVVAVKRLIGLGTAAFLDRGPLFTHHAIEEYVNALKLAHARVAEVNAVLKAEVETTDSMRTPEALEFFRSVREQSIGRPPFGPGTNRETTR